ncbi:MAG TPA: hypothetical protein VHI77_02290 [Solirubrobacterales bacterium]|nr:hypothetical protein [Solirubrobacterales bacterium]
MPLRATLVAALLGCAVLAAPAPAAAGAGGGNAEGAIVVISGDVDVRRGEIVEGVYVVSGDTRIAGRVEGDVVVLSGDVVVSGTIEGDLFTASGTARLLRSAVVTGDVEYASNHPDVSALARVHGNVREKGWPDLGGLAPLLGGFLVWLAVSVSLALLGALALLIAPRAADAIHARSRERVGPLIAIGIAIFIALPVAAVIAAITVVGLPLALLLFLALLPLGALAYAASAYVLGRRVLKPPRERILSFLAGIAILRLLALVPLAGLLVDLAAVVFGLGLIGAAIGSARSPRSAAAAVPAQTRDS